MNRVIERKKQAKIINTKSFYKEVPKVFIKENKVKTSKKSKVYIPSINEYKKIVGKRENRFFDDFSDKLRKIETVKYEKNTFILFFNEINAIHEVTPRENNPFSRRLVNIIGEYY